MGSIWQDQRTDEQKQAAAERAEQRRQEWDDWYAASAAPVRIISDEVA
jgi:hypothetical protein